MEPITPVYTDHGHPVTQCGPDTVVITVHPMPVINPLRHPRLSLIAWVIVAVLSIGMVFVVRHSHLFSAAIATWNQDWSAVRRNAESYLRDHPDNRYARLLLARSFWNNGDWNAATRIYQSFISSELPLQDLRAWASHYQRSSNLSQAEQLLQVILEQHPQHIDTLIELMDIYQRTSRTRRLRPLADEVIRLAPNRVEGWIGLAQAHLSVAEPEPSIECLQTALELDPPNQAAIRKMLADIFLLHLNQPLLAQKELEHTLQLTPHDVEAMWMLAESFIKRQPPDLIQAEFLLNDALKKDPENRRAQQLIVGIQLGQGNVETAQEQLDKLLQRDPENHEARHLLHISQQMKPGESLNMSDVLRSQSDLPQTMPLNISWNFTEITEQLGLKFQHDSGEDKERRFYPETLGSGVALFDYDNDGDLDLYFVNAHTLVRNSTPHNQQSKNRLFRNNSNGTFTDVTDSSGLGDTGFGHGVAVGDYDNDGQPDLYVTNFGSNSLYHNNGDGSFYDVSKRAQVNNNGMSTGASWLDYDEDGDLDLYVANYAIYDIHSPYECTQPGVGPIYCSPDTMHNQRDSLYQNNGDGTFSDVSQRMGISRDDQENRLGKGLGVLAADLNHDGHIDLCVANDLTPNFLFYGNGKQLIDFSEQSGTDRNSDGLWESCMGIDAGDIDMDGDFDLFVTNQWMEKNTLYRNVGELLFQDVSEFLGLGFGTKRAVGWGTALIDFDKDGDLDNFVTNGHFYDWRGESQPFRQSAMLWENDGTGLFLDVSSQAGDYFQKKVVGRGAAFGDLDNDADIDIVLNHWNDSCVVLQNNTTSRGHWLRVQLTGTQSNRDAIGTAIRVVTKNNTLLYQRKSAGSYLSSHDARIFVGLGSVDQIERLEITWPRGMIQSFENIAVDRTYRITEGQTLSPIP